MGLSKKIKSTSMTLNNLTLGMEPKVIDNKIFCIVMNGIEVYDFNTWTLISRISGKIYSIGVLPNKEIVYTTHEGDSNIWNFITNKSTNLIQINSDLYQIIVLPLETFYYIIKISYML